MARHLVVCRHHCRIKPKYVLKEYFDLEVNAKSILANYLKSSLTILAVVINDRGSRNANLEEITA